MEVIQVIGEDGRINWVLNGQGSSQMTNAIGLVPLQSLQSEMPNQQYILLGDNTMVPLGVGGLNNVTFLANNVDDSDDNEIPPHALDHMYARKPREPGTEQVKPPRRRLKKKELINNQLFVQESLPDYQEAPKINIIRQRLPGSSAVASYPTYRTPPKILHGARKLSDGWPSQTFLRGETGTSNYSAHSNDKRRWNQSAPPPKSKNQAVLLQESELPQLGALVTVGVDGCRKSLSSVGTYEDSTWHSLSDIYSITGKSQNNMGINFNSSGRSTGRKSTEYRTIPPGYVEVSVNPGIDGLDPDDCEVDESELFLDFPMEEAEEVATLDVDFSEIPMSTGTSLGPGDVMGMNSCLEIPSGSESNLNSSHFQKSLLDSENPLMMGPDSSLVIKDEISVMPNPRDDDYIPRYAPTPRKGKLSSPQYESASASAYLSSSFVTFANNSSTKKSKAGDRPGRGRPPKSLKRDPPIAKPIEPPPPPVTPLRISSRSRRVPNRLDDEDVILSPVKRNKR